MTNESTEAVWIESDGVSNIPPQFSVGVYEMRSKSENGSGYCLFNGKFFEPMTYSKDGCETQKKSGHPTKYFESGFIDAWRDYQGLITKPTQGNVILDPMGNEYRLTNTSVNPVTITFGGSLHPVEVHVIPPAEPVGSLLTDAGRASIISNLKKLEARGAKFFVMPTDEPGIQSAKYAAKYEAKQEAPTIINGMQVDPAALAAFLASQQPAPIPNTTPRGILTMFNERADHRLGLWQGAME